MIPATWGDEPFRIGLWVGTDVSPKRYEEAEGGPSGPSGGGVPADRAAVPAVPVVRDPIGAADMHADTRNQRVYVYCGDELAECPFSRDGDGGDGLPVLTVDEEIYRLAPAFVIATVDKFARLAREGEAASLFGYVSRRCERHGYVHPDYPRCNIQAGSKHPKDGRTTAASRSAASGRPI